MALDKYEKDKIFKLLRDIQVIVNNREKETDGYKRSELSGKIDANLSFIFSLMGGRK